MTETGIDIEGRLEVYVATLNSISGQPGRKRPFHDCRRGLC